MKHLFTLLIATFLSCAVWAQTPQSFRYQAVARDNSGNVLANQNVSFRISILSGSVAGTMVYYETHTGLSTNAFGLVEMEIGKGTPVTGTFSSINWGSNSYFVKVEMDPAGGSAWQTLSTSQLLSVPYALHAKTVEQIPDNSVTSAKIADGTITSADIGSNAVTSSKIADGTIAAADIASNAITTAKVANSAITGEKIADGTITGSKIAQQSAASGQILKWNGTTWAPASDETGIESNPFVSSGGITRNTFLTDDFVFGSASLDYIVGAEENNSRMFFNKSSGSIRAGKTFDDSWDEVNTGLHSAAFGFNTRASGIESFASGRMSSATGVYSTAMGVSTVASGMASTAIGGATKATGDESTSMGYYTVAAAKSSVAIGQYNVGAGSEDSWVATDPVFEIGIGSSDTEKANAVTVLKNGNVGIGPANPAAKLEVAGQVKITGGSPGAGKILTSDAGGLATWQKLGTLLPIKDTLNIYRGALIEAYNTCDDEHSDPVGILGVSLSENENWGTGVRGIVNGTKGSGVTGGAWALTGVASGVTGYSNSLSGAGVYGYTTATQGNTFGVKGESNSPYGYGIYGISKGSTGGTGVWGACYSTDGYSGYFSAGKFYVGGNAGFGTSSPAALLHAEGTGTGQGNVVFVGQYKESSPGNPPVSGAGTRMMWYPDKAAFRAGQVIGTQWDAGNIGNYSTALGWSTIASGDYSLAVGLDARAIGDYSFACGRAVVPSGEYSTAIGNGITSSGRYSLGIGQNIMSTGNFSTAIGERVEAPSYGETVIGCYNSLYTPASGTTWNATDRIFVIGNGTSLSTRSNAITVLKNGNTGLGTANPGAKLEIAGQVKITGGSPGAGKVLTSDANGLAIWQLQAGGPFSSTGGITSNSPITDHFVVGSSLMDDVIGTADDIRLFFNKTKGAFRAGRNSTGDWNDANVGQFSAAFGDNNKASGPNSFASGVVSVAAGSVATAMGYFANATAMLSTAVGSHNVGAGTKDSWVETDPIFEIGNGTISTARSNAFTVLKNGNTGIGTHTPSQKLHIKGSAAGNAVLYIEPNKWNAAGDYGEIRFGDHNHYIRGEYSKGMTFNDADKFVFTGGNVGIGTSSPAAKLDVSASQGPNIIIRDSDGGAGRPGIQFINNDIHFIGADDTNNEVFGFYSQYGSTRTYAARLNIHGPASANWGKYIGLTHDGNNGRIDTDAGYLVIDPAGNRVGVETDAPTQSLDVNGNARFRSIASDAYYGVLNRKSDGTLTTATSDIRLKENIENLNNSLEKVMQLRGVSFTWKTNPEYGTRIGFIAQEFEKVIPELVFTNEVDGYKGINYAEVTAVLVEAIKELKTENDLLRKRLEQLEVLIGYNADK
jgi:hypothetical protein